MYNIYIPKHNDFNSPERRTDEIRYFNKNKGQGKTYQDYIDQLPKIENIVFNKIIEYSPGELGVFLND